MLPKPSKINIQQVMNSAEARKDLVTFESSIKGMGQIVDQDRVLIVTGQCGLLILNKEDIPKFIEELENIYGW